MAALSITKANVAWVSGPIENGTAGEAVDAGDCVYRSAAGTWLKAQCDGTTVEAGENGLGLALGTADASGARIGIAMPGAVVSIGAGAAGTVYCPGTTVGDLIPTADLATTNKATIAAQGLTTNRILVVGVYNAAAVVP